MPRELPADEVRCIAEDLTRALQVAFAQEARQPGRHAQALEHAACRSRFVRRKARLVREGGDSSAGERAWRSLALAARGRLS